MAANDQSSMYSGDAEELSTIATGSSSTLRLTDHIAHQNADKAAPRQQEGLRDEEASGDGTTTAARSAEKYDFPDGGLRAWSVVAGGWCCLATSFGWIMCIGVFQDYYEVERLSTYSSSTIAWIQSVQSSLMFLGAPVFGKIFDAYGPRSLLIFGTFFHLFGLIMLSISTEYYQIFLAQGVCSALGMSSLFYAGNNTVSRWFHKRRALATGIVSSGSALGGLVISFMAEHLLYRVGFGWTVRIIAFVYGVLLIVPFFTVRTRLAHRRTPFSIMEFLRPLRLRPVYLTAAASFFVFLGLFIPYNFIVVHARHQGMRPSVAAYLLAILNATGLFGRILPAWAGDKFGCFNVMIVVTWLCSIFVFTVWTQARTNSVIILFSALYGFTSGSFVAMTPALVAQLSPTTELGVRLATNSLAVAVAVVLGNPIGGAFLGPNGEGFIGLQVFAGGSMAIGASIFVFARLCQSTKLLVKT